METEKKGFFGKLKETFFGEESDAEKKEQEELQEDIAEAEKVIEELEKKEKEERTEAQKEKSKEAEQTKSRLQKVAKEELEKESRNKSLIDVLKTIEDPELGIDIWTLGLIYNIDVKEEEQKVHILMTFTSIMCPVGPMIVQSVEAGLKKLENIKEVKVEVTFEPPWEPTEELREMLGV